jgi:Myb/SANT-like DNA-binding domain
MPRIQIEWDDAETEFLVEERRRRNYEYHFVHRRNKVEFWESISRRIQRRYGSRFTARQCEGKFRNLIKEYRVSK